MADRRKIKGEILRNAKEIAEREKQWKVIGKGEPPKKPPKKWKYADEMARLQLELLKLQETVRLEGLRVIVVFEGRDAAGKGGVIKRISEALNPRICRIVALGTPTEREKGQWYFQRYVAHLPAAGEMVLLDRSWYNRAGVERVMGFCTEEQYRGLPACRADVRGDARALRVLPPQVLVLGQRRGAGEALHGAGENPIKRWKLSPMDLESRKRWVEYSKAKDVMLAHTDKKLTPWFIVNADDKKRARLNCIAHFLQQVPYQRAEADRDRAAAAPGRHRLQAPEEDRAELGPGDLLEGSATTLARWMPAFAGMTPSSEL